MSKKIVKNVQIRASFMKTPFESRDPRVGKQYSCILQGEGLAELGLQETNQKDGFWYNNNAVYGKTGRLVPPVPTQDMNNQEVTDEFGDGTTAHLLFVAEEYKGGTNRQGKSYEGGTNWLLKAIRVVDFRKKHSAFDDMDELLLADGLANMADSDDFEEIPF